MRRAAAAKAEATAREVEGVAGIAFDVKANADAIQGLVGRFRV